MIGNDETGLRNTRFNQKIVRRERGQRWALLANQLECEVNVRQRRAGRYELARAHHDARFVQLDVRITLTKQRSKPPRSVRVIPVEKRAVGENEGTRTCRADPCAALRPLA